MRTHQVFTVLLLTFCCCPRDAVLIVHRVDPNRQVHAPDGLKSRELRKFLDARFGVLPGGSDKSLIDCIAQSTNGTFDMQKVAWRGLASIAKICSSRHGTDPRPLLSTFFSRVKVRPTTLRMRQSLITRRIFRLLRLARRPTLQYINSSLNKVLAINSDNADNFDPVKYVRCSGFSDFPFTDPDVPRKQRRLGRSILNLLKRADDQTLQKVCKRLYRRFNA